MAKYILRKTAIFIGEEYFPEESIMELSESEAERISKSISAGFLEKLSVELDNISFESDRKISGKVVNTDESPSEESLKGKYPSALYSKKKIDKKLQSVRDDVDSADSIDQVNNSNISLKNGRKVSLETSLNNLTKKEKKR
ncbi:MAG: hypothetical protein M0P71_15415 [Melioribacteraceae bacterium]|nr:hypothetical protein [Melioribacteraceae bacterium]